ncbi:response regulator, partial [Candidatus Poribacteria bacterium]|nr:response regulator [Candidatus Poribacteria bacterium]
GEISVESKEGSGSTFRVILPISKHLFTENEKVMLSDPIDQKPQPIEHINNQKVHGLMEVDEDVARVTKTDKPVLLIVEDNEDLRKYLSQNLEKEYQIVQANNGKTGLDLAFQYLPDLIISDLMMPEMNGSEMIHRLMSSEITNHIPVIILTAKADKNSKLAGLEDGADDYLFKPFDADELRVRVNNLIQQRTKLRNHYRQEFLSDIDRHQLPAPEDNFLVRTVNCIEKHIAEPEFNVSQLGQELGLSRTQLYRKIIAITDHTPTEYIRNIRLKMAARMFHEGHDNITSVLYTVGFNSPSYFTRCFREVYGVNPSDYVKKLDLVQ